MQMMEQNGGKFRRLEIKQTPPWSESKSFWSEWKNFFPGNVIALCVDSDEKIKNSLRKKIVKKNNFAGGLGCEIWFAAN